MKVLMRVCLILQAFAIPITCILIAGVIISRVPDFYSFEFTRLQSIKNANISVTERDMARLFSDYINGKQETFQLEIEYNQTMTEIFSVKEQMHMKDVKKLIDHLTIALGILAIFLMVSIIIMVIKKQKRMIRSGYNAGLFIYLLGITAISLTMLLNFEKGFTIFHEIFFANDLWRLDPEQDVLLMIMPQQFFLESAVVVLAISTLLMLAIRTVIWHFTKEHGMFYGDRR